jgi:hypothetical protein
MATNSLPPHTSFCWGLSQTKTKASDILLPFVQVGCNLLSSLLSEQQGAWEETYSYCDNAQFFITRQKNLFAFLDELCADDISIWGYCPLTQ